MCISLPANWTMDTAGNLYDMSPKFPESNQWKFTRSPETVEQKIERIRKELHIKYGEAWKGLADL